MGYSDEGQVGGEGRRGLGGALVVVEGGEGLNSGQIYQEHRGSHGGDGEQGGLQRLGEGAQEH